MAAISSVTLAVDFADFKFIGFYENGKYLAVEESGEWDIHRSGNYATTYFVRIFRRVIAMNIVTTWAAKSFYLEGCNLSHQ